MKLLAPPKWENPYLEEYREVYRPPLDCIGLPFGNVLDDEIPRSLEPFRFRDRAIRQYAWAIPTPEAIACIANYSPILEVAAGRGYWARLLELAGADVLAFDDRSWKANGNGALWTDVVEGSLELVRPNSHRSLFLCWPPYATPLARHALARYQGGTVIFVGEHLDGCTADDAFFGLLDRAWHRIDGVALPQHYGINDYLGVYRRRHT